MSSTSGIEFRRQDPLPIIYKGRVLDNDLRIDILVPGLLIVEVKAVQELSPIHEAQLLTYMKLAKIPKGLLINFNVRLLKEGIKRRKL